MLKLVVSIFLLTLPMIVELGQVNRLSKFKLENMRYINFKKFDQVRNLKLPTEQWHNQSLDHFDHTNRNTWKQRYFVNDTFFKTNGPVFLYIVGEWEASPYDVVSNAMTEYANKFGALCVSLEHRFYGKSWPTIDLSTSNLRYLNIDQALADTATFRQFIVSRFQLSETNKWIVFGGSYAGTFSAFLRLKYPHLIHAAVASSAPMFAVVNFSQYLEVVQSSLNYFSPTCSQEISKATNKMQDLIKTPSGRENLESIFKTCEPLVTDQDVQNFFEIMADNFAGEVQYNNLGGSIKKVCDMMTNVSITDPLDRLVVVNNYQLSSYQATCLDISYDSMIDYFKETSWDSDAASDSWRQWMWQTCTEFGWYQSSDSIKQPFGQTFPIKFMTQWCADIYGPEFTPAAIENSIKNTNTDYGGYGYQGTNIIFVNGKIDPWHIISIFEQKPNPEANLIYSDEFAHCAEMRATRPTDTQKMLDVRARIVSFIESMLKSSAIINKQSSISILSLCIILFLKN